MYGADYWKRTDLQQICEFMSSGSGDTEIEKGEPEERHLRYGKAIGDKLRIFRDNILAFDWNSIDDDENKIHTKTEEMFEDINMVIERLNQISRKFLW